jgi:hypothetical protein
LWGSAHCKIAFQSNVGPRVTVLKFAKLIGPSEMTCVWWSWKEKEEQRRKEEKV